MKKVSKKILSSLILIIILMNSFVGVISNATEINSANLIAIGNAEHHLKYYREDTNSYRYLICTIVGFYKDNNFYPAYCMNKDKIGVTDDYTYTVNVNEIINRDDVWRAVINGYPYKTPSEMGLASEFDAYAVTKFAVYCLLGESSLEKFYAESDDQEAVAMLNALNNLVNIGRNGTQTRNQGVISISKSGEFFENGDYYIQKYNINSNIEINDYELEGIENFPDGCFVKKINNSEFELNVPKNQLGNKITGNINIKGNCRTYPVFYGETNIDGTQDYVLTYDSFGNVSSKLYTEIETNCGKIRIKKIDEENKKTIPNVKFGLYQNTNLIAEAITNNMGIAEFNNLYQGNYVIKELESNFNYYLNQDPKNVTVTYNKTSEITITNKHKKGNLKIIKCDYDNKDITLGGIEFKLYKENNELIGKYTTDLNGEIYIQNLNIGNYIIKEIKAKNGYSITDNISVKIDGDKTTELEITNEKTKGRIKIIKVDKDNNEIKLEKVKFGVFDNQNNLIETLETDKNGEAISSKLPIYGKEYYIKELETQKEYILNNEPVKIELKENEITNIKFENELKKGNLEIYKIDKYTKKPLCGVVFELYKDKELINKYTTDENGKIYIENLKVGEYSIKEIETNKEYELNSEEIKTTIKYNETTKLNIENEKIKSKIKIIKIDKDNNEVKLEKVKFGIYNSDHKLIQTIITNKNGEAYTKELPIYGGEYYVKELETKKEYVLNNEEIKVELNANEIKTIKFENELKKGSLEIIKTDKDTKQPIKGVVFELYNSNNKLLNTLTTDENGKIFVDGLKEDKDYYIKEKQTGKEYKLLKEKIKFNITYNEITKLQIENEKIKGRLKVIKIDKDDPNIKLEGVKFEIYDEESNLLEIITTDKDGIAYSNYLPSVNRIYSLHEISTLPNYVLNDEYTFFKVNNNKDFNLTVKNEKIKEETTKPEIEDEKKEEINVIEKKEVKILPRTGY